MRNRGAKRTGPGFNKTPGQNRNKSPNQVMSGRQKSNDKISPISNIHAEETQELSFIRSKGKTKPSPKSAKRKFDDVFAEVNVGKKKSVPNFDLATFDSESDVETDDDASNTQVKRGEFQNSSSKTTGFKSKTNAQQGTKKQLNNSVQENAKVLSRREKLSDKKGNIVKLEDLSDESEEEVDDEDIEFSDDDEEDDIAMFSDDDDGEEEEENGSDLNVSSAKEMKFQDESNKTASSKIGKDAQRSSKKQLNDSIPENVKMFSKTGKESKKSSIVKSEDFSDDDDDEENENDLSEEENKNDSIQSTSHKSPDKNLSSTSEPEDNRTVFVGNIPLDMEKSDLIKIFRKFGKVESVRFRSFVSGVYSSMSKKIAERKREIPEHQTSLRGYVVFETSKDAEKALQMNGEVVDGRHLRVDKANWEESSDTNKTVFVGNLAFDIDEEEMWATFSPCGSIDYVRLVRCNATAIGRGIGYVTFKDENSAQLALKLNGTEVRGRNMRVEPSVQQKKKKHQKKDNEKRRSRSAPTDVSESTKRTLFVSNLPYSLEDENELCSVLSSYGEIEQAKIIHDHYGRSKGLALVCFKEVNSLEQSLKCENTEIGGRKIFVQRATSSIYPEKGSNTSGNQRGRNFRQGKKNRKFKGKLGSNRNSIIKADKSGNPEEFSANKNGTNRDLNKKSSPGKSKKKMLLKRKLEQQKKKISSILQKSVDATT